MRGYIKRTGHVESARSILLVVLVDIMQGPCCLVLQQSHLLSTMEGVHRPGVGSLEADPAIEIVYLTGCPRKHQSGSEDLKQERLGSQ